MKKFLFAAFAAMALIQWLVPGKMIWDREAILQKGKTYKFRTAPVDPANPFQGRYVALNFSENQFNSKNKKNYKNGQNIYLGFRSDDSGYAKIYTVDIKEPSGIYDYVEATISYVTDAPFSKEDDPMAIVYIDYPFKEYYMEEFKAPKAEKIYRDSGADSTMNTYAIVKVYKGGAVIQDLIINNKPIKELLP
jgi:uncharacterized membrane-anchored protein